MASRNRIDLKVDGGWCDEPWMNLRPTDVGLTKSLVTKPTTLSAAMQWLTLKNSTEPLSSFVQCIKNGNRIYQGRLELEFGGIGIHCEFDGLSPCSPTFSNSVTPFLHNLDQW